MGIKLELQKLEKGTIRERYRLAIPKSVIESHGWQDAAFDMTIKDNQIILKPIKK